MNKAISDIERSTRRRYPYIVVHFMPAVYQREDISVQCGEPKAHVGHRDSFVHHPAPFAEDGTLTPQCEDLLIAATHDAIRRTRFRMCLVWGPKRCTFLERDGAVVESDDPPSGGIGTGGVGGLKLPLEIDFDRRGTPTSMKKKLVYRVVPHNGGVVFAAPERAACIARIHGAIKNSKTWGEFRAAMPRKEYSQIVRSYDEQGEPRPRSADEFSGEFVPGWEEGDYPPWLQTEMDRLLPESLLRQFGTRESTFGNGSFWMIPKANLRAICAALKALGWELERAQRLPFH